MCFESSEDFSSWISGLKSKTKSLYESTPLGVCILLLLGFLVLLYLLLLPFGFFAKSTPSKPLLLATALPVTPVNTMIQCDDKKAIHCLQIKHAFYTHDSQLYAKLQINTALKTGNHAPGQKLVPRTNYSSDATFITALHTHLLQGRGGSLASQSLKIFPHQIQNPVWGSQISAILSTSSFLSLKLITFSDQLTNYSIPSSFQDAIGTPPQKQVVSIGTFSLDWGERKENIFLVAPCHQTCPFHYHSEVVMMPMELSSGGGKVPCSEWWCSLPLVKRLCVTFPISRCSLGVGTLPWKGWMGVCPKLGQQQRQSHPSNAVMSVLLCH